MTPRLASNVADITATLELIRRPSGVFEVRVLGIGYGNGRPHTASGYFEFNKFDVAAEAAAKVSGKRGKSTMSTELLNERQDEVSHG